MILSIRVESGAYNSKLETMNIAAVCSVFYPFIPSNEVPHANNAFECYQKRTTSVTIVSFFDAIKTRYNNNMKSHFSVPPV